MTTNSSVDIGAEIEKWRGQLLDTSKRNRLISFKPGSSGGVNILHPGADAIWRRLVTGNGRVTFVWKHDLLEVAEDQEDDPGREGASLLSEGGAEDAAAGRIELSRCLDSFRLQEDHVLTDLSDKKLASRLGSLALHARTAMSEMGVTTLYFVVGLLRWFEREDSQVEFLAPLMLLPARLDRENVESPWTLGLEEQEVGSNHSLIQSLRNDFDLELPPVPEEFEVEDPDARHAYFERVRHRIRHLQRWEILDRPALGLFNFQKIAMWEDLGKNRGKIEANGLCCAIAGVGGALPTIREGLPSEGDLDTASRPDQTHHILDSDSSQHAAIEAAKRGASLVLDGPPGTGKSQTIANIIGEALADGKTVLFVSEKAAALDVVKRRLDARGLGDFCLECHSHKANKRAVITELGRCLHLGPETYPDRAEDLRRLYETRARLNAYVRALHAPRLPMDLSAYQVHGRLAKIKVAGQTRCPIPDPLSVDPAGLPAMVGLLDELLDCRGAITDYVRHPWRGVRTTSYSLNLRDDVAHHFARFAHGLTIVAEASPSLARLGFGPQCPTLTSWDKALGEAREAVRFPVVPAAWFGSEPRRVAACVIDLNGLAQQLKVAWSALPEFSREYVRSLGPEALRGLAIHEAGVLAGRLSRPLDSVLDRAAGLADVAASLRSLAERANTLQVATDRVALLLGLQPRPLPLRDAGRVIEQFSMSARMGTVKGVWFDPTKRQELQQVVRRCRDDEAQNSRAKGRLLARLSPAAFSSENAAMAERSASFRAPWSRLLPAWWSYRSKVSALYPDGLPPTATLLDDLRELNGYHRRRDYARQVVQGYASGLLTDAAGATDWEGTLWGLEAVEIVAPLQRIYPELKDVFAGGNRPDESTVAGAVGDLDVAYRAFRDLLQATDLLVGITTLIDSDPRWGGLSLSGFETILEAEARGIEGHGAALKRLGGLLKPGHDLPIGEVAGRLAALRDLGDLMSRVDAARAMLGQVLPAGGHADEIDWEDEAALGRWLIEFLDRYDGKPPGHLVRVFTSPDVRAELAEAVRSNLAGRTRELAESWKFLQGVFPVDKPVSTGIVLGSAPVGDLATWAAQRASDVHRLQEWVKFAVLSHKARGLGLEPLFNDLVRKTIPVEDAKGAFLTRFYRGWLDAVYAQDEALRNFETDQHERLIEEFRTLDRESVRHAPGRIRQRLLNDPSRPRATAWDVPGDSELGTLLREVNKRARHLPLRHLFARTPTLLRRLKPCLMMSPLAVSTYLDSGDISFDLVIFDEASQVRPHDAISAIYRGRQLVVAGDQKQLPPTNFFARAVGGEELSSDSDDTPEDSLTDFESILDVCSTLGLPRKRLLWHYRSRREALIAFSNRHFYDNDLVSFPSVLDVDGGPAVRFEYLPDGRWLSGRSGGYNPTEARRTAELVFEHFRDRPGQSLGVIAFSQRQQLAILTELEAMRAADPSMETFFEESRDEAFFVKNLENVQGDERDMIFLSIAYGPDENGKVAMRFGPLNQKGGERRLNVAVTRARASMMVVSSLRALDLDLSRTDAVGVRLLRAYLDFAERGPVALREEITSDGQHEFDSPFEREVAEALKARGLVVHQQVGCGGFRIDLAVMDPNRSGRYVLGVECDGATYHSSATARDRDRLRQAVLESLGWRICRIWSTDWIHNPGAQIDRVLAAFEAALGAADPPTFVESPAGGPADLTEAPFAEADPAPDPIRLAPVSYRSIDEVPPATIRELLFESLTRFGITGEAELVKSVSRQLGFQRTGARISNRITGCLDELIHQGKVGRTEQDGVRIIPIMNSRHG